MLKGFTYCVVKSRPHLADQLALPIGPGVVRQQSNGHGRVKIDP
jgi:hypothetical protein